MDTQILFPLLTYQAKLNPSIICGLISNQYNLDHRPFIDMLVMPILIKSGDT